MKSRSEATTSIDQRAKIFVVLHQTSCGTTIASELKSSGKEFMRQVALLLLVAFSFSSCSTPSVTQQAQSAAGGIWAAEMLGGNGAASGFSFTTEFTLQPDGTLTITYFQFLNSSPCFPVDGGTQNGTMGLNTNESTGQTSGIFKYTVQNTSNSNKLTLNGNVTGTEVNGTPPLSNGSITGSWTLTGGSGCSNSNGTFTMTQSTSTSTSSSGSSGT